MAKETHLPLLNQKASEMVVARCQRGGPLETCWAAKAHSFFIAGCSLLDTQNKVKSAVECVAQLKKEFQAPHQHAVRLAVLQLGSVGTEWEQVQGEHGVLLEAGKGMPGGAAAVAHLCHPTEALFLATDPGQFSEFAQRSLMRILDDFNAEAWIAYIAWFNEDAEHMLRGFAPEASEEYQLQARLEDLRHEVHSHLLQSIKDEIYQAATGRAQVVAQGDRGALLTLEKGLLLSREHLKKQLVGQHRLLHAIAEGIAKIESAHPELIPLKRKAQLLWRLIQPYQEPAVHHTWGQQLLLMQLLDDSLGVTPLVSCHADPVRVALVIAIRLAFQRLKAEYAHAYYLAACGSSEDLRLADKHMQQRLIALVVEHLKMIKDRGVVPHGQAMTPWGVNQELLPFLPAMTAAHAGLFGRSAANGRLELTRDGQSLFQHLGIFGGPPFGD